MIAPDVAQALSELCRSSRRAPLDVSPTIAAFVAGVLARGPVAPEVLLELLEDAGIEQHRWREAARAFAPPAWVRRAARRVIRLPLLERLRLR